jgi:hypothetical protein
MVNIRNIISKTWLLGILLRMLLNYRIKYVTVINYPYVNTANIIRG